MNSPCGLCTLPCGAEACTERFSHRIRVLHPPSSTREAATRYREASPCLSLSFAHSFARSRDPGLCLPVANISPCLALKATPIAHIQPCIIITLTPQASSSTQWLALAEAMKQRQNNTQAIFLAKVRVKRLGEVGPSLQTNHTIQRPLRPAIAGPCSACT